MLATKHRQPLPPKTLSGIMQTSYRCCAALSAVHAAIQGKKISCPTCRARTKVTDVAYVDNGRGYPEWEEGQASSSAAQEAAIQVEGSYGTKVTTTPYSLLIFMPKARTCVLDSKDITLQQYQQQQHKQQQHKQQQQQQQQQQQH